MHTFKSQAARWARYKGDPANHTKRRAGLDAARIAGPAPAYPPTAPVHGDWLGGCINGHTVIIRLMRHPTHRSDQWAAEIDGEVVAEAAGLTALWEILHLRWPRALSRRQLATLDP